ncbi:MAG: hypothetical protein RLZ86_1956, partial [Actinomycetota bacterium]
ETLGIVGESGCGKSTTGRAIMQLPRPTSGQIVFEGTDMNALDQNEMRRLRTKIQMIFQDPISSLNPRRSVLDIVTEPLNIWKVGTKAEREEKAKAVLEEVGIDPAAAAGRRAHQFSGGQCQRISIARSLVLSPSLIICDEPVSALDVSVQAQVLNLLEDLKRDRELTLIFIAHEWSCTSARCARSSNRERSSTARPTRIPKCSSTRFRWPTRRSRSPKSESRANHRHRCCRRAAVGSTRAAHTPRTAVAAKNPNFVKSLLATSSPATSRCTVARPRSAFASDQRFSKRGGRFSTKAFIASRASSVWLARIC